MGTQAAPIKLNVDMRNVQRQYRPERTTCLHPGLHQGTARKLRPPRRKSAQHFNELRDKDNLSRKRRTAHREERPPEHIETILGKDNPSQERHANLGKANPPRRCNSGLSNESSPWDPLCSPGKEDPAWSKSNRPREASPPREDANRMVLGRQKPRNSNVCRKESPPLTIRSYTLVATHLKTAPSSINQAL
uniref:Uncharacterized protein n=1 Tax=Pinguiococcus pyrenoidosus TaxID=172671 RepID=A0A7R9UAR2_9STRA|mmetsp:Transcript_3650/g.14361  ORF Transcript_3650/g.14361 Transcript_3650/m.14361 type:complete len:191 (+) Transcript_3650:4560-5132(+)